MIGPRFSRRRLVGALIVVLVAVGCGSRSNVPPSFNFDAFAHQIASPDALIINGLILTVSISIVSQIIGVVLGVFAALGRLSRRRLPRWIAGVYIWIFRGTPLLVQIALFYFGLGAAHIFDWPDVTIFGFTLEGKVQAGIFALGVNEGAYMAEIVRAGIIAIDPGQMEAARSLGMTYMKAMRRIVLPQAARVIVPPLGNEFNNMLKTTSLLFVIGITELYTTFANKQGLNFLPFEMYLACALWFLLLTTIWSVIQGRIEQRLSRGTPGATTGGPGWRDRLVGFRRSQDLATASGGH
jgi:polar amino acid transport system permease protein